MSVQRVGVVGAGTMGHGIAQVFAAAGIPVVLQDTTAERAAAGIARISKNLDRLIEKEKMVASEKAVILTRLSATHDLQQMESVDLVIEAASENQAIKLELFRALDGICPAHAVLATNTSSISITKIAAATQRAERVIGMHFMNPVPVMKLVEIIRGMRTGDEVYRLVHGLTEKLGKVPVAVNDSPGFVANRILMPMINEAIFTLSENIATAEGIDAVMMLGMNHPMGPLALADLIGLDTCLAILEVLHEELGDPKYRPCPLLRKMVDAGLLGRKSGRGFYTYKT
ncbi:MAG: 3-hydroxybutyryl-CoA dehydrogenase [Proteobacteria bacterium]|nr:MAG: 3-hydroxybutyryl-CoA dehydrogenase [Pseudomonadota bacterium]